MTEQNAMPTLLERCAEWLDVLAEADDGGAVHWSRELAGAIAAAPPGLLKHTPADYRPQSPGYPLEAEDSNPRPARLPWTLRTVVEHGLLAWAHTHTVDGIPLPASVVADLVAVRPYVPELDEEIGAALARSEGALEA